ncbi:MAG: glycoside hydrolase family 3 N-terminal domain-containing protein, partial [Opitutaceae bacterium]
IYHNGWIDLDKNGVEDPYENPRLSIDERVDDLLRRMTVDEKTAQLATLYGYGRVLKDPLPTPSWKHRVWHDGIGNIDEDLNGLDKKRIVTDLDWPPSRHARALNEVQRFFIEDTRLGIPADFTNEGIRGLLHTRATSFPCQLAVGSTWDRELVRMIGVVTGREARALGYTNVYSPIADLARDPRWGRTPDSYSEDPYLAGELIYQQVKGIQSQGVVSTVKHFVLYGIPKGGRDGYARTDPECSWLDVEEIFLPPFYRAVHDAGALGVMASYNDYAGVPIEGSRLFLTEILRRQFGFRGYVVSDSEAVENIQLKHRVAGTPLEAVREAIVAGLDVRTDFTEPEVYVDKVRELVRTGQLSMAMLNSRVRDILRVKFWLGLFDRPYVADPAASDAAIRRPDALAASRRAARESIVLLRNQGGLLPLRRNLRRVFVTGPLANNRTAWDNRYGPQQLDFVTVLDGLRRKLGPNCLVDYDQGCDVVDADYPESDVFKEPPSGEVLRRIEAAADKARGADVAIAVLGETDRICREAHGRLSLDLPGYQEDLLEAIQATGVPVVLVLSNGRPLSVSWAASHVPAIVEMWFPGEDAGNAIADVLFGDVDPSGRLPMTVLRTVGQVPFTFPWRPGSQAGDIGMVGGPLYPFGFGLSYTTFAYRALHISPERQGAAGEIQVSCEVSNTGDREGTEVVQLYLRDDYSSTTTFDEMLRGFERVRLRPGETKPVHFTLTPRDLQLYDRNGRWTVEPGRFTVMVGASSADIRLRGNFTITRPDGTAPVEDLLPDERPTSARKP